MSALLWRLFRDEEAQDLAEYGIALAVIGGGAAGVAFLIATDVDKLWSKAETLISSVVAL